MPKAWHEVAFVDVQEMDGKSLYEGFAVATMLVLFMDKFNAGAATVCAVANTGENRSAEAPILDMRDTFVFSNILINLFTIIIVILAVYTPLYKMSSYCAIPHPTLCNVLVILPSPLMPTLSNAQVLSCLVYHLPKLLFT